jgi:hypothetical protein
MSVNVSVSEYTEIMVYSPTTKLIEYHGWAKPGTAVTTAAWKICMYTYTADYQLYKIEWADGTQDFNKKWSIYNTYSFS